MMTPTPLYHPSVEHAAYLLRYSWTGWPSGKEFSQQPTNVIAETKPLWEGDGLRVLEYRWTAELVQILFSCTPGVAPQFIAARAKGRLDHALRQGGIAMPFSRKVAVRAIGENTRRDVEAYIERQVGNQRFVDPQFAVKMNELTVVDPQVDLSLPTESARGRYWHNLHLVLVVDGHAPIRELAILQRIRDSFWRIADKKRHAVSRLSVMPDHLHAALRGQPHESPLEIALAYQNNLSYLTGQTRIWSPGFYVGTFGEYAMQAVRHRAANGGC
jgi:REP element-mobilizing transposase RayT